MNPLFTAVLVVSVSLSWACGAKEDQPSAAPAEVASPPAASAPAAAATAPAAAPGEPDIAIKNGRMFQGHLLGGQPTAEQLAAGKRAGYVMVIGMQTAGEPGVAELKAKSAELGLEYVDIPVAGTDTLSEANARALSDALERGSKAGKVMVVCRSGNRVGAMFALKAHYVDGAPAPAALALGDAAGLTSLRGNVAALLSPAR